MLWTRRRRARQAADLVDANDLEKLGYRQQFARTMGGFSSFAVSFSLISIITGIFTNFGHGLRQAGPAVIWSWAIAVLGQFLVALVVAELANQFPVSGYGYQWASRLVGPRFGFFVGWMLLIQWVTGFPGICKTLADQLHGFLGYYLAHPPAVALLTVAIISLIAAIHLWGIRFAALVNDAGVLAEIAGALALTFALLAISLTSGDVHWGVFFDSTNYATQMPASLHAFALSLLLGAWCITGFEGAADLAEETHRPRQTVPRAVILSELTSGLGGFVMLGAFIVSMPSLHQVQSSQRPLLDVIRYRLGDRIMPAFLLLILVSIFACGVASMAATTRLLFALARDNMLPASGLLSRIHPAHRTPRNAIVAIWCLTLATVVALENFGTLDIITSIATICGYLGYGGIALASLTRFQGPGFPAGFRLGRWRNVVAGTAVAWTLVVVFALTLPAETTQHPLAPLLATATTLAIGAILYATVAAGRIARGLAGPPPAISEAHEAQLERTPGLEKEAV